MLQYLINFFYPPRCAGCGSRLGPETVRRVCAPCLDHIERFDEPLCAVCGLPMDGAARESGEWCVRCAQSPPHFGKARAITRYRPGHDGDDGTVPSIIRRHKYGLDQSLALALAECLGDKLPIADEDYDIVIPVPLHRGRLRWRGFNQAALLASAVARRLDRPLDVTTLVRMRPTPPQTSADHRERQLNVRRAFAVKRPARIANRRGVLVDDRMATRATADPCAPPPPAAGAPSAPLPAPG